MKTTKVFNKTLNAIARKKKLIVSYGGTSSSKTVSAMQVLYLLAAKKDNLQIFFFAQTVPKLKTTLKEDFKRHIVGADNMRKNMHEGNVYIVPGTNSQIIFLSADEPDKFLGVRSDYVLFDEINTYRHGEKIFINLFSRCRGTVIATFNPSSRFWIVGSARDKTRPNYMHEDYAEIIHSTYLDNQFTPQVTIENILSLAKSDENYERVYIFGEWGVLKGLVYQFKKHWNYFNVMPKEWDSKYFAGDFGFTNDPATIIEARVCHKQKKIYAIEHLYERELHNDQLADKIKAVGDIEIVMDSNEPKSISELRHKYKVRALTAVKGADSVVNGIDILKRYEVLVWHKSKNLSNEYYLYKYPEEKDDQVSNNPIKKNDHLLDPLRYIALKYRL